MTTVNTAATAPGAVVDIRQFGAVNDGGTTNTDNAAAINAALAAANTVIIPDGDFAIASAVTVGLGQCLKGVGYNSVLRLTTAAAKVDTSATLAEIRDLAVIGATAGGIDDVPGGYAAATADYCIQLNHIACTVSNVFAGFATNASFYASADSDGFHVTDCDFGFANGGANVGDCAKIDGPGTMVNTILRQSQGRGVLCTSRLTLFGGRIVFNRLGLVECDGSVNTNAIVTSHGTFFENAGIISEADAPLKGGSPDDVFVFYVHDGDGANGYAHIAIDSPQQLQMGWAAHLVRQESGGGFALTGRTQLTGVNGLSAAGSDPIDMFKLEDDCHLTLGSVYSADWSRFNPANGAEWSIITPRTGGWAIDAQSAEVRVIADGTTITDVTVPSTHSVWTDSFASTALETSLTNTITPSIVAGTNNRSSIKITGDGVGAGPQRARLTITGANNWMEGTEGHLVVFRSVMKGEHVTSNLLEMTLRVIGSGLTGLAAATPKAANVQGVWYYFEIMAYVTDATQDIDFDFSVNASAAISDDIAYLDRLEMLIL